jgi:hypothetical protein
MNNKYEAELKKSKMIGPSFTNSYFHDNGKEVDEFGVMKIRKSANKPPKPHSVRMSDD